MVAQRIDWPAVRKIIPAMIEALADRRVNLDAVVNAMAARGRWAEWQTEQALHELQSLRMKLLQTPDVPVPGLGSLVDELAARFSIPADQAKRIEAALQQSRRLETNESDRR